MSPEPTRRLNNSQAMSGPGIFQPQGLDWGDVAKTIVVLGTLSANPQRR
jgi:hypothetical protein